MENLELKHLAPYLPYGLKVRYIRSNGEIESINRLLDISDYDTIKIGVGYKDSEHIWMFKPILKPISDFDKFPNDFDLDTDFEASYYSNGAEVVFINTSDKTYLSDMMTVTQFLFENHFDVFGLINRNLAIDINTLES